MHLGHDIIESLYLGYIKPRVCSPLSLARSQANERNLYIYKTDLLCGAQEPNIGVRMFRFSLLRNGAILPFATSVLTHTYT